MSVAGNNLDSYRPMATVDEMPIRLERADVAGLPGAGRLVFASNATADHLASARALGNVRVTADVELFAHGLRRLLNTYVAGMHAGYGLSALADPTTFLLAVRRLADTLYGTTSIVVDASPGNASFGAAIDALYPDAARVDGARLADLLTRESPRSQDPVGYTDASPRLSGRPIFVVGCPRSGTTWLQSMLLAHPGLRGPSEETAIFSSVKDLVANPRLPAVTSPGVVAGAVREFVEALLAHSLTGDEPTRLVEKTPHHALHLDIIESLFPDAYVIAIYRDGREVVRSLLEVPFGTDDAARAARAWVESTTAVERFTPQSLQVRNLRYEALREAPVEGIAELLEWAGLAVDDAVRAELHERSARRVSGHNQRELSLSPADARAVYRFAGDRLVELGYIGAAELADLRGSVRYRIAGAVEPVQKAVRRVGGKLRRAGTSRRFRKN